ncbi:MAG: Zn-dependent protease with chaperone function [Paraglaciecola sp.]|jgi:Zn-dependent protease with chaperone function
MNTLEVPGKFYLLGRSQCLPVTVLMTASGGLRIVDLSNQLLVETANSQIKVAEKLASVPREFSLYDQGLVVVDSTAAVDTWIASNSKQNKVSKLEKSMSTVLLCTILVPIFLFVFFKYLIPSSAILFADYVPKSLVNIASKHTLSALDSSILAETSLDDETRNNYQNMWQDVISKIDVPTQFNIQFRQSETMGANAFALPNGTIVITDELVKLIDDDHDLLTAILLHEIGHIEHKHSMRLISEALATSIAVNYFFADLGGLVEFFAGISNTVVQNQFSQKLEWEADNYALSKLDELGMDRESFADAMKKLADTLPKESKLTLLLQSHPSMQSRIDNARDKHVD